MRLPKQICDHRYEVGERLGSGSFGTIYKVIEVATKKEYAAKIEDKSEHTRQIKEERTVYQNLPADAVGYLKLKEYYSVYTSSYRCLILTLVGKNLDSLMMSQPKRKLSLKTVLMIGIQLIDRIETLHKAGFVHRDIKPDNLAMGLGDESPILFMLDLGLGKRYISGGKHISLRTDKSLTGTARYASIRSHKGYELSRRDDMESIAYVLIYLLRGSLPWQGYHSIYGKSKYNQILDAKLKTKTSTLCALLEPQFGEFLDYTRKMDFTEEPDYEKWRKVFREMMDKKSYEFDYIYCWTLPTDKAYLDKEAAKEKARQEALKAKEARLRKLAAQKKRKEKLKKRRVWAPNFNDDLFPPYMPLSQRRAIVLQQMQKGPVFSNNPVVDMPLNTYDPYYTSYEPTPYANAFGLPPSGPMDLPPMTHDPNSISSHPLDKSHPSYLWLKAFRQSLAKARVKE
ncbi:kinase-like domain-containing protein [Blakeslea trispora]|nr:kinase-like domain-containing protein [Blakeslea trispora]